ncbi:hypothetical protein CLOM_g13967 [Closterium sp. NIES-68]|nr:hypothetical protein CLOM_g13967 [Closterium sp. NIES-68]
MLLAMAARASHGNHRDASRLRARFRVVRHARQRQSRPARDVYLVPAACYLMLLLASCYPPLGSADIPALSGARGYAEGEKDGGKGGWKGGGGEEGAEVRGAGGARQARWGGQGSGWGGRFLSWPWSWSGAERAMYDWASGQVNGQDFQMNELEGQVNGQQSARSAEQRGGAVGREAGRQGRDERWGAGGAMDVDGDVDVPVRDCARVLLSSDQELPPPAAGSAGSIAGSAGVASGRAAAHGSAAGALNPALPTSLGSSAPPTNNAVFRVFSPFQYGPLYVTVSMGSPPRRFVTLVDTLSSLSWLVCDCAPSCPAPSGIMQHRAVYESSSSAAYRPVACNSSSCPQATMFSCNAAAQPPSSASNNSSSSSTVAATPFPSSPPAIAAAAGGGCAFNASSGGAASGSSGAVISDLISLLSTDSLLRRARVTFGCSSSIDTSADNGMDGVLALGARPFSIPAQLASPTTEISAPTPVPGATAAATLLSTTAGAPVAAEPAAAAPAAAAAPLAPLPLSFSLCFDSGTAQGALVLGDPPHPGKLKTTSFMLAPNSSRYYLNVTQMRVGSSPVPASDGLGSTSADAHGGIVVDTSFPYLALRAPLLLQLVDQVFSDPSLVRQDVDGFACATLPISKATNETFPPVAFDFPDASYLVHPSTYLMLNGVTAPNVLLCLAAVPLPDDSVHNAYLGTQWLADHYLWFDVASQKLHFRSINCSTWDYLNTTLPPKPPPAAPPSTAPAPSPLVQPPASSPTQPPAPPPASPPAQPPASPAAQPPVPNPTQSPASQPPRPTPAQPPAPPPASPPTQPPASPPYNLLPPPPPKLLHPPPLNKLPPHFPTCPLLHLPLLLHLSLHLRHPRNPPLSRSLHRLLLLN